MLSDLFILPGFPGHIRSDNAPSSSLKLFRGGSAPWEQGQPTSRPEVRGRTATRVSFNVRLRDELPDGEIFHPLREAQIIIVSWRQHYNAVRPHASQAKSRKLGFNSTQGLPDAQTYSARPPLPHPTRA